MKQETTQVVKVASTPAPAGAGKTVQISAGHVSIHGQRVRRAGGVAGLGLLVAGGLAAAGGTLPLIGTQPQGRSVPAGTAVTLSVGATGEGPLGYEWWNAAGPLYPPQRGSSLVLPAVQPGDAGRYSVRVRNAAGTVTSAEAVLEVSPVRQDNLFLARATGGAGAEPSVNLDTDAGGNVYAVGTFSGVAVFGGVTLASAGAGDVFVVKYGPDGGVVWAKRAGGAGADAGVAVSVDSMGNAHVTGGFSGAADFGGVALQSSGGMDAFLATYDRDGNVLWARALGGVGADMGCRVASDAAGNSYVAGEFAGAAGFRGASLASAGESDVFLAKWSAGGFPLWATRLGGAAGERATGLTLDEQGGAVLAGLFAGTLQAGGSQLTAGTGQAGFVVRFGRGGAVQWAARVTGILPGVGMSVLAGEQGEVFLTGAFAGTAQIGDQPLGTAEPVDGFVAKFTLAGKVAWAVKDGSAAALGLAVSTAGTVSDLGAGTLDWSGGEGAVTDLMVGSYKEPAVATWARQAGADSASFRLGMIVDGGARKFLAGFIENPDGPTNLEGDSLALIALARPAGPPPPEMTQAPQSLAVAEGTTASFQVTASGQNLGYQWLRDGRELPGQSGPTLTLTGTRAADAGRYSVVVYNEDGAVVSADAGLTVTTVVTPPPPSGPIATISSPAEGTRVTNTSVMVFGQASSPGTTITRVEVQNNGGSVTYAGGTATWFSLVALQPGTNVFRARAVDANGATGAWTTRTLVQGTGSPPPADPVSSPISIAVNGQGTVTPNLHGQSLVVGASYTLTAIPAAGSVFTGWSGSVVSTQPTVSFTMQSNLALQANFAAVTPPPPPVVATNSLVLATASYVGLFYERDAVRHSNMGPFSLSVAAGGAYTGSIRPGNKSVSFSGRFSPSGQATNRVTLNGLPLEISLNLGTVEGVDQVGGMVRSAAWESRLWAARVATGSTASPVPEAGRYTLVIPGHPDSTNGPAGHGYGTLVVDATGKASLSATLGDGTAISRSGPITAAGLWPFYAPLYSDKGFAAGWIAFTDRPTDDLSGNIAWEAPAQSSRTRYPRGFTNVTSLIGSRYVAPTNGVRVLDFEQGTADLAGGYLRGPFQNQIYLSATNKVFNLSSNKLSVSFSLSSGTFSGSATEPATGKSVSFKGAVLQKGGQAGGVFHHNDRTGMVELGR